ncbi:MAG TPA: serine hydrolase domain-containing protein [Longimicrobium sp.]|jgi:CubicO group peptidase (beta-lactamase class C family)|uniref:serine hydrolase domain-containing protein n=1 Tax=Longimicrobium sp. TaxID=2029185 RepID=UPI002ED782B4
MTAPRRGLLLLPLILAACAPRASSSAAPAPAPEAAPARRISALTDEVDRQAPLWLVRHQVPSVAIAYIRNGRVAWTRVYGEQAPGVPATPATLYNVASLAKPVSAETMLRLAAAGRVSLDEPLAGFWVDPDVAADPRHQRLTPRIALSHRTGFPNWRFQTEGKTLAFQRDPGTTLGYSGEGFEYARRFAQQKLDAEWESLARRYVMGPLRMNSTTYTHPAAAARVALPFGREGRYGEPSVQDSALASDDLYTTVGDYAAFLTGVIRRDGLPAAYAAQRDSMHVVNEESTARCDRAAVAHCPRVGMGLGWEILEFGGETVRMHSGADWGESTLAFYFAETGDGAVILTNGANGMKVSLEAVELLFPATRLADYARSFR